MSKELFVSSSPHETKVAVLEDDELVEVYHERDTGWALVGSIYKGRVTRVLPGMQSAFVDIGLERDAFLYVSDFFEDSEEYEKVVAEAEARVGRVTAAETAMAPLATERPAPLEPPVSETDKVRQAITGVPEETTAPAPAEITESAASLPLTPQTVPGESATLPVLPESPALGAPVESTPRSEVSSAEIPHVPAPPAHGEHSEYRAHDHRGRRRRRRGRGGFGEQRYGPKREVRGRPQEAPANAAPQGFEILPGESLAKYSHSAPESRARQAGEGGEIAPYETGPTDSVFREQPRERNLESAEPGTSATAHSEPPERLRGDAGPSAADTLETIGTSAARPAPEEAAEPVGTSPESAGEERLRAPEGSPIESAVSGPVLSEESASERPSAPSPSAGELGSKLGSTAASESGPSASGEEHADASESTEPADSIPSPADEVASSVLAEFGEVVPSETRGVPEAGVPGAPEQSGEGVAELSGAEAPSDVPPSGERSYTWRGPQQRQSRFAPRRGRRGRRGTGPAGPRPRTTPEASRTAGNNQPVQISQLLKEGQEVLVQIAKEPLGTKGARITSHVALPGRYLVYMPTIHHIGVSRKIASEEERLRLRHTILENRGSLTGGFIVRTAGQGRSEEEFKADLRFLTTLWNEIRAKFERGRAPALLHRDLDLTQRILRDILSPDFKRVRVDNEVEYERIVDFVSRCQPSLLGQVKLYAGDNPMFEEFGIQAEIDQALKPKVWLKSGGFIVINQTEALVAIDVNTGKYVGKTNRLEDTIVKTNIDAVKEIVRQVRLRDLGGIIVIDFIDMDERRNRQKVVQALEEALRRDRAPTNILSINEFGLVALTRKRVKQSLERTLCEPCHYCGGSGWIKSVTTVCYEILSEARKMASQIEGRVINLRVNPEVARALKSREGILLSEMESLTGKDVVVKSDPTVQQERFEIF